jgi:hypothetical protein
MGRCFEALKQRPTETSPAVAWIVTLGSVLVKKHSSTGTSPCGAKSALPVNAGCRV